MHRLAPIAFVAALAACSFGGGDAETEDSDAGPGPDSGPSYSDADFLFEPDRLIEVEIEISDASWDAIRLQTRNILELFGPTCAQMPAASPFTYQEATVTVEGERLESVGVRKKGFLGSLDEDKPSLKLKFNEYVAGQRLSGLKRMTLNNGVQDPSLLNQCLGYELFRQAGVPAPRCNFARVSLNGESLGIYVHVESVKKPFLALHFDDNEGNLYEGTLSDFRDGWMETFERKTNESDPPGSEDRSDLAAIAGALSQGDAAMLTTLEGLIDLDAFYSFWAIETMTSHWDGYSGNNNNFFVYGDPTTGKMTFMPWGADQLFGNDSTSHDPAATRSALTRRLYLYGPSRQAYLERYQELLDTVWDDAALSARIDDMVSLIGSSVPGDEQAEFASGIATLRANIAGREAILRQNLSAASPADAEALGTPLCFTDTGSLGSDFDLRYNGGGAAAPLTATIGGQTRTFTDVTAFAGPDDENDGMANIIYVATDDRQKSVILLIGIPRTNIAPGTVNLGQGLAEAFLLFTPEGETDPDEVYFVGGTVTFTAANAQTNAPLTGTLDLSVWTAPFL